jgi:adenine-specific DNA-methyltransferase
MEQNNENILSEETIGFIKKCYIHLNQARQGVWAFADLAEIVWNPKLQKKNKELYFSIIHDAIAYEIIKYEEILEMSELKTDFLAFYSKFVSKINTSHEYTNFLEDRITTLENRFGLVWKEQEEQLLKIVSEDEIILGVGKFLINKEYDFDGESKDKKKKFIKNKEGQQFTLTRKRGDSFLYFCKEINQLFLLYSVQNKINVYSFVENHYTKYYPILVKKGDKFGFGEARDNLLIEGDNYFALQLLQFTHRGKIDVIYIDPPYNTGNGDFKYNDAYVGSDDGSRHSKWLSFMDKRLILAKELLSDDGLIFISIDDNEQNKLNILCEQIFKEDNFIANFIWKKKNGGGNNSKICAIEHEYILCYAKNKNKVGKFNEGFSEEYLKRYSEEDSISKYYWDTFRRNSVNNFYDIECPDGKMLNGSWLRDEKTFKEQIGNEIKVEKNKKNEWNVYFKQRLSSTKLARSIITGYPTQDGTKDFSTLKINKKFDYPKPVDLIYYLLKISTKQNSIVLDFFAGSGTMAQALVTLNKNESKNLKFIVCTNNENNICEDITYSRLDRLNNPSKFNLDIEKLEYGLEYLQIKHISDLDLENADDIGNFENVKQINNIKFGATKTIQENDYLYITDTYSVFKKANKNKQKEYCEFFEHSIKEHITNLVFVSSDRTEYDYFRKVISDYISTLEENQLFEKIRYYQMSKNYMDNMLSIINGEEEIDVEKYMVDEENQENGEQQ